MKKIEKSILVGLIFSIFISSLLPFCDKCGRLKKNIIRLHVIANSNSEQDQALKLKIKDNISCAIYKLLKNAKTKVVAKQIVYKNLNYISQLSKQEILNNGYNYDVNVTLTKSYFPTRKYDSFILPAGVYDSLKVIVGKGEGKNWWCVAFPPMCSPMYSNKQHVQAILGKNELEVIEGPYEYKFAIIEFLSNIKENIEKCIKK